MLESPSADLQFNERDALAQLSALLGARTGLVLAESQWVDLRRAVTATAGDLGLADFHAGINCLLTTLNPRPLQILIDHLTIGETYFFRDNAVFALLREQLLPTLIHARRASGERCLRIWSAGCSSGEEAYSIAIELTRALPDLAQWNATVLATDINQRFLRKAAAGIYERWSFRNSDPEQRAPYIERNAAGRYAIAPAVRALVNFSYLNLAERNYPSAINGTAHIDIIFCRNVLMYLQPAIAAAALQRLSDALVPGGWLIVSNVEAPMVNLPAMTVVHLPNLILFHKEIPLPSAKKLAKSTPRSAVSLPSANAHHLAAARIALRTAKKNKPKNDGVDLPPMQETPRAAPEAAKILLVQAKVAADHGHFERALTLCEQALGVDKLNPAAHYLHASILLESSATHNEYSAAKPALDINAAAENSLKRALYLDSEFIMAHIALGNLLLAQPPRRAQAERYFANARALLKNIPGQQPVAESDGLTAAQLLEMIDVMSAAEIAP